VDIAAGQGKVVNCPVSKALNVNVAILNLIPVCHSTGSQWSC